MRISDLFLFIVQKKNVYKKSCFVNQVFLSKRFNLYFEQISSHHYVDSLFLFKMGSNFRQSNSVAFDAKKAKETLMTC